ncbi:MAG: ATP-binding protein, partial [Acidobacteria bacterium]|nr:ATP-binding protein [Acidobacteriota bacterium]
KADTDLLKQALLNIIINGCQVMPHGGKLIVETGQDDGQIFISITDHGPGIPEDARDKIFNLYYTTKPKGSGIGLAQAFRAVQLHNGRIKVESEVGAGTSFRIILPAA